MINLTSILIYFTAGDANKKPFLAALIKWWGLEECGGDFVHGVCIFGTEDLPGLIKKKHGPLFANKFDLNSEPIAYECMEAWITYRTICPDVASFDLDYYTELTAKNMLLS